MADDETGVGADAADLFEELSDLLLYQPHGADGQRSIRLVPVGFKWPHFYRDMVSELLLDLGEDVVSDGPVRVALAKHAAELVDDDLLSVDFRLNALDCLNPILAGLRRDADGGLVEAEELT